MSDSELFQHDEDIDVVLDPKASGQRRRLAHKLLQLRLGNFIDRLSVKIRGAKLGRKSAAKRLDKRRKRDEEVAAFARRVATTSDELANNPKQLAEHVSRKWEGESLSAGRVYKILSRQGVLADLRR